MQPDTNGHKSWVNLMNSTTVCFIKHRWLQSKASTHLNVAHACTACATAQHRYSSTAEHIKSSAVMMCYASWGFTVPAIDVCRPPCLHRHPLTPINN
jgi:hypothetical protein